MKDFRVVDAVKKAWAYEAPAHYALLIIAGSFAGIFILAVLLG